MATQSILYGTRTEFGSDANLNSLATGASKPLGAVSNSSALAIGYKIDVVITLGSSGVSAAGSINFFLAESYDGGTNYTDGISPTSSSDVTASMKNVVQVGFANANAVNQVVRFGFDLPRQLAPKNFTIIAQNNTGAAFTSTANVAYYTPINYTVA